MKWLSLWLGLALSLPLQAQQLRGYGFRRSVDSMAVGWNKIVLPPELLAKVQTGLQDLRVVRLPDSSLAPFFIWPLAISPLQENNVFLRNESWKDSSWFIHLVPEQTDLLGRFKLRFANDNFDWRASLQGSHDGRDWFDLVRNERLLAFSKDGQSMRYTDIVFPESDFAQYRLQIHRPGERPILQSAIVMRTSSATGSDQKYATRLLRTERTKHQESIYYFSLSLPSFVNSFQPKAALGLAFSREARLEFLADSLQINGQWQPLWQTLAHQKLRTGRDSVFHFQITRLQQLRLVVEDGDNEPLQMGKATATGPLYQLLVYASKPGDYAVWYGHAKASAPNFDLREAVLRMPKEAHLPARSLGPEQSLNLPSDRDGLQAKPWWLWVVLAVVGLLLGVFGLRLLKTPSANA